MNIVKCNKNIKSNGVNFKDIKIYINKKFLLKSIERNTYKRILPDKSVIYLADISFDYRDELSSESIKDIITSKHPKSTLNDTIYNAYFESESIIVDEIIKGVSSTVEKRFNGFYKENDNDFLSREFIINTVSFDYNISHFESQKVCVNVVVDTGDANYEFTANNLHCLFEEESEHDEGLDDSLLAKSSLIWLCTQQGYNVEAVKKAILEEDYNSSKFLASINEESLNTTSCINALTFMVDMTLGQLIDYMENKESIASVTISKDCNCGLINFWNGSGSILNIALDKEVVIPSKYIDSITIDGYRGSYSIQDIYGNSESDWNGQIKF